MFGILQLEKEYYSDRQLVRLLIEATSTRSVESLQRLSEMRWAELKKMNVEGITGLICEYCICKFQYEIKQSVDARRTKVFASFGHHVEHS